MRFTAACLILRPVGARGRRPDLLELTLCCTATPCACGGANRGDLRLGSARPIAKCRTPNCCTRRRPQCSTTARSSLSAAPAHGPEPPGRVSIARSRARERPDPRLPKRAPAFELCVPGRPRRSRRDHDGKRTLHPAQSRTADLTPPRSQSFLDACRCGRVQRRELVGPTSSVWSRSRDDCCRDRGIGPVEGVSRRHSPGELAPFRGEAKRCSDPASSLVRSRRSPRDQNVGRSRPAFRRRRG